jgi:hypothetical protein
MTKKADNTLFMIIVGYKKMQDNSSLTIKTQKNEAQLLKQRPAFFIWIFYVPTSIR